MRLHKMKIEKQIENLIPKVEESEKTKSQLRKNLDEQLYNNLPRKKVSKRNDININKYKGQGSYRGDSLLDD